MSCYLRHLKDVFESAGIEITKENRQRADKLIHELVGLEHKDCPQAWAAVKERLANDRESFTMELARRWKDDAD